MKAKPKKSPSGKDPRPAQSASFKDHDLCGVNPLKTQFEPTPAKPLPQRFQMAGGDA